MSSSHHTLVADFDASMGLVQTEEALSTSWSEERLLPRFAAWQTIKEPVVPSGDGGTGQLNNVNRYAYMFAIDRIVRREWLNHPAYMASNGRIDRNHNVELHLMAQISHTVLTSILVGLKSERSSFWTEVMGQLASKALIETPLRDIAPIIAGVQAERKKRDRKRGLYSEEKLNSLSLEELLLDVVASSSKDPPPEEDSDGCMPGLVLASS